MQHTLEELLHTWAKCIDKMDISTDQQFVEYYMCSSSEIDSSCA